jgi:hypothetical protein
MRKTMIGMVGIMLVMGGVAGPPPSEAADACSLNGTYNLSGLAEAGGFLEFVGNLVFTPNGPCTSGTVGGSVTVAHQNQAATILEVPGTYSVTSDGVVTVTVPGVIQLTGLGSFTGGGVFNTVHFVVTFDPPQPQALSATATRNPPMGLSTVVDRSPGVFTVSNTMTLTSVYAFNVPANTLVGGKLLRGRLLYDYTNNTLTGTKNLSIALTFGGSVIAQTVLPSLSAGFAPGELEFVVGDTIGSLFQHGGFRGVQSDRFAGLISVLGVGTANENLATPRLIQIVIGHSAASPDLTFRKLSVVLELL